MVADDFVMHYVCTLDEARDLIARHERFWVEPCGCREGAGTCKRSRHDVCLIFRYEAMNDKSRMRELTRAEVEDILVEATTKKLVPRPFRDPEIPSRTDGVCFCCDCCCGYFTDDEKCNRGAKIEETDAAGCNGCGDCLDVCYFDARSIADGVLTVERNSCYGCGLCADVCPTACIKMVARV